MDDRRVFRGIERAESSVGGASGPKSSSSDDPPALMIGGVRYEWADILPALAEAGGAEVIEEFTLDAALREECARRGIAITEGDVEAEGQRLLEAGSIAGDQGQRAFEDLRRARGLGPVRFRALLERTAMLRALVRDRVTVDEAAIERAYRQRYADRYDIRVLVTRTAAECQDALERVRAGASFAEQAVRHSIDPSAASGGLILGVSTADLAWPQVVRSALPEMTPGEVRGPMSLERAWALVKLENIVEAGDPPSLDAIRQELARDVRLAQERLLMDAEAGRLTAGISVETDRLLRWASESLDGSAVD